MEIKRDKLIKEDGGNIPYLTNLNGDHWMVLLCLHGFAGDKDSSVIAALMQKLNEIHVGIVAFDWPAHGESDAPDESLTVDNCLEDLDIMYNWVYQKVETEIPIACFATSFGGYLATLYRNENPYSFLYLIMRSPALKMDKVYKNLLTDEEYKRMMQGHNIVQGFDRKMYLGKRFYDSLCDHNAYS